MSECAPPSASSGHLWRESWRYPNHGRTHSAADRWPHPRELRPKAPALAMPGPFKKTDTSIPTKHGISPPAGADLLARQAFKGLVTSATLAGARSSKSWRRLATSRATCSESTSTRRICSSRTSAGGWDCSGLVFPELLLLKTGRTASGRHRRFGLRQFASLRLAGRTARS
jgi:hypothetical protein